MSKIRHYRLANRLLKISKTSKGLRGKLYQFKWDTSVSPNKRTLELINSADFIGRDAQEYRVKEYFDMNKASFVPNDNYINIHRRIIWSNEEYDEWEAWMRLDYPDGVDEDGEELDLSYEKYYEQCDCDLWDEKANLNIPVDGVIVAFANLGLWDGKHNGAKRIGNNVKNIFSACGEYNTWYCDLYNVRCDDMHHDGTNHYLYRVAKSEEQAERLINAIAYEGMTEEQFMKATKSLRPYVGKTYGW